MVTGAPTNVDPVLINVHVSGTASGSSPHGARAKVAAPVVLSRRIHHHHLPDMSIGNEPEIETPPGVATSMLMASGNVR